MKKKTKLKLKEIVAGQGLKETTKVLKMEDFRRLAIGLQAQIDANVDVALSGTINEITYFDSATTIASLAVATYPSLTELSYVKGVTSSLQTQINAIQGTVTSVSSVDGNATIATATTTPAITIVSAPKLETARTIAGNSFDGSANITIATDDLSDVVLGTPAADDFLKYNGAEWTNLPGSATGGAEGSEFYMDDTSILPSDSENLYEVNTLTKVPAGGAEDVDAISVTNNTVFGEAYLYNTALGGAVISAGTWTFSTYASVSSTLGGRVSSILRNVYHVDVEGTETVTIVDIDGTSATATASGGTPFDGDDDNADITLCGYLQTPKGLYQITGYTSATVVTIATPAGYIDESAVAFSVWKYQFGSNTGTITALTTSYTLYQHESVFTEITIAATDKLAEIVFGISNNTTTVNFTHNGTENYSHLHSPLVTRHNDLPGLNGGTSGEYYHMTSAQHTIATQGADTTLSGYLKTADWDTFNDKAAAGQTFYIGTTQVAINRASAALTLAGLTLTTPDIGTPSAGTLTNCTFPTLNQNTSGTAANLSGTPALPNGTTATTQSAADNTTKLATTAYADTAAAAGGATTALDNLASVAINLSLTSDTDITDDLGTGDIRWKDIHAATLNSGLTAADTLKLRGYDVDGTAYVDVLTITSNNTVTADLNAITTIGGNAILYSGGDAGTPSALVGTNISGTAAGLTSGTVTNATLTTALTVDTGTLTLTANVANNSVLTIGAGAVSVSGANTGDNTVCTSGTATTAATLATARNIGGVSFDGSAAIVPTTIVVADTVDTTCFVGLWESATGSLLPKTDAGLSYNAGTGMLTATGFTGPLTGEAATVATITGLAPDTATTAVAQGNITSLGTLTTLSVDNITINGNDISSTAGIDLTISPLAGQQIVLDGTIIIDAGVVTGATSITSTAFVGALTGEAATVATIAGLAPNTATTQATQASITTCANLTTVGALNAGSITSGFTSIDVGAGAILTTGDVTGGGIHVTGDTAAGDNAALGYTATEGLIMTGQGSTNDLTFKNDADGEVMKVLTGTTELTMTGNIQLGETSIKLDATLSADAKWSGITTSGLSGVTTLAIGDLIYLNANDSRWELVDANLADGYDKQLGIALTAAADGAALEVLLYGKVRSAVFPVFTVGSPLYISETAGDVTHTQPVTADVAIRIVGFALTAEDCFFNPSNDYIIHTG